MTPSHASARPSRAMGAASLAALFAPGMAFAVLLAALADDPRFAWVCAPLSAPWELFVIAASGIVATVAGALDWRYHRLAGVVIARAEQRAELLALTVGGMPLFVLMATATVTGARWLLLPAVAQTAFTTYLIAYDEVRFHRRRCQAYETALHRVLVLGQLVALLAWMHLAFVRPLAP